ncbi:MAG TPA: glutamine synthetase family protein [Rhizomicrobium sp.]|nr:glutamine synthetase family protein [Rhizomicrobium sp.]
MNQFTTPPAFARPAFVEAADVEFKAFLLAHPEIEYLDAVIVDICGILRGKRLGIAEAAKIFESGMQIPESIYLMDARGEMTDVFGHGYGDGDPDATAWPIAGTLSPVWGEDPPRAQILTSLRDEEGVPFSGEPRAALDAVLERFAEAKLTPVAAMELEFYLLDIERDELGRPQPPHCPRTGIRECEPSVYGLDDLDRYRAFLNALTEAAKAQNLPLTATSKEYAPGQFEANVRHQSDARLAADHIVFLKQAVKAAARSCGFEATFMAKPFPNRSGSGLHVHVSVLDKAGRNIFDNNTREGSDALRHAIAGLQTLMPESMALFAPNTNSYRRFQPDMFAPANRFWGINNRSAGLRIPIGPADARRLEHRVSGADANPYLVLAAVLAGVHLGLETKRDPGPPITGNVSREPDPAIALNIDDALTRLFQAKNLASYLGPEMISLYRETKRVEAVRFRKIISAAEYDWYL